MGCLRLLREPWFFAVRGNHEDMLLDYAYEVVMPYSYRSSAQLFFRNGGSWVETLDADAQQELREDLLPRVVALPYVMTIGDGDCQASCRLGKGFMRPVLLSQIAVGMA